MKTVKKSEVDSFIFNEIELILAEKRTALSGLRTGIAIFALPLTVLSALIATSHFYDALQVLPLLIAVLVLNGALVVLGVYLIVQALRRIHHYDHLIREIKLKHSAIADFID